MRTLTSLLSVRRSRSLYQGAGHFYQLSKAQQRHTLGPTYSQLIWEMHRHSLFLYRGRDEEVVSTAAEVERALRACASMEAALRGEQHPLVLQASLAVADFFALWGRFEEAKEAYKTCIHQLKRVHGKTSRPVLTAMHSLAVLYDSFSHYTQAENLLRAVLSARIDLLGDHHYETLDTLHQLAVVLERLGKHEEAELMHSICWKKRKKVLGEAHPDTLWSLAGKKEKLH